MDIDEQIKWYSRGAPSHLQNTFSSDCPELDLGAGGHGEEIAIGYRLKCHCGSEKFEVTAFHWQRDPSSPEVLLSPVRASCPDCGNRILVFDSDQHGYDPVCCELSTTAHGEQEQSAVEQTIASKSHPATVDIIVYYPDDLFEPGFEEFADRRHDLFTWISIIVGENTEPDYPLMFFECA